MASVGLTVYGPEVARSGLTSKLDQFITREGRLEPGKRFFAVHSRSSIEAFYSLTGSTHAKHWPLVLDLFDMRPVCATLWIGDEALSYLQNLKGKAQPAQSAKGTIRSRFYCDNPVTNLVHVSDSESMMREELRILRAHSTGTGEASWKALNSFRGRRDLVLQLRKDLSLLRDSGCGTGDANESCDQDGTYKTVSHHLGLIS